MGARPTNASISNDIIRFLRVGIIKSGEKVFDLLQSRYPQQQQRHFSSSEARKRVSSISYASNCDHHEHVFNKLNKPWKSLEVFQFSRRDTYFIPVGIPIIEEVKHCQRLLCK